MDSTLAAPTEQTSFDWWGPAILPTHVEIFGTRSGGSVHGEAEFAITNDTAHFTDRDEPVEPDQLKARGRPTMRAVYPGIVDTDAGFTIQWGGLGFTWHIYPDYSLAIAPRGPNLQVVYASKFAWYNPIVLTIYVLTTLIPVYLSTAPGTYLSVALFPDDPFYRLQRGGRGMCGAAPMETLRSEMHTHETLHYKQVIALRQRLQLHTFYEAVAAFSPGPAIPPEISNGIGGRTTTYFKQMKAIDNAIDRDHRAATSIRCDMRFP